ncbi:MAG: hypothetical protein Q7S32_00170 [bacterium]|nr:hypothetical protein [bacterium]
MIKNFVLAGTTLVSSLLFWWKALPWLGDPFRLEPIGVWLWPAIMLVIMVACWSLTLLLVSRRLVWWIVAAGHFGLFLFFFPGFHPLLLAGVGVGLIFYLSAMSSVRREKENRLQFSLISTLRGAVYRILTATFILISFAYFLTPAVQSSSEEKELPSGVVRVVQVLIGSYLGEEMEGEGNPRFISEVTRQVVDQVTDFLNPYFQYLPPILAFSLFLALQGLGLIFLWVTLLLSSIIFLVLKLFKIVTIQKVTKEAEVAVFN